VAVTDTYSIQLCVLPPKKGLTVVQIWHAVGAVKKFSYQCLDTAYGRSSALAEQMCMHKNYDYILCTSEATRSIYVEAFHTPRDRILVKGMPRVDYIQRQAPGLRKRFLKERPDLRGKKLLLYLPTFREGVDEGTERLLHAAAGRDELALLVKPHPLSSFHVPRGNRPAEHWSTYDLMKVCDGIITDYSAASLEASLLNKPIYLYLFDYERYAAGKGLNVDLWAELPRASFRDAARLAAYTLEPYDYPSLYAFRDKYVETAERNNTAEIAAFLVERIPEGLRSGEKAKV
jgi:CDP-ribitol ribitolphosphotransferase